MSTQTKNGTQVERARVRPRTDVFETPEALIVVADVPGATHETIEVTLLEDVLTLRARPVLGAPEGWRPSGAGFELPDYERSFRIAADIDREALEATIRNGRLEVVLKKRLPRSHRVEVKSS